MGPNTELSKMPDAGSGPVMKIARLRRGRRFVRAHMKVLFLN